MNEIIERKMITTGLIGIGCTVIGITAGIIFKDKVFAILSLILFVISIIKAFDLYFIDKKKNYFEISGKCIGMADSVLSGTKTVKFQNDDTEVEVVVPKNVKIKEANEYVLCFKKYDGLSGIESKFIRNKLLADNYIGMMNK